MSSPHTALSWPPWLKQPPNLSISPYPILSSYNSYHPLSYLLVSCFCLSSVECKPPEGRDFVCFTYTLLCSQGLELFLTPGWCLKITCWLCEWIDGWMKKIGCCGQMIQRKAQEIHSSVSPFWNTACLSVVVPVGLSACDVPTPWKGTCP